MEEARRLPLALREKGREVLAAASDVLIREAGESFDPEELAAFERVGRSLRPSGCAAPAVSSRPASPAIAVARQARI
ncbi:MAG: hypothetical protein AAGK22_02605 [Acidobacteriota bacterium]